MADTLSTTSTLDNLLPTYFVRKALPRLMPGALFYQFGDKTPLPTGNGKTVQWNAWSNFGAASAAIGEGVTPHAAAVSSRKVTATVAQYVRTVKDTDLVDYASSLDIVQGIVDVLTDSAAMTIDNAIQLAIFRKTLAKNADTEILSAWMSCVVSGFHAGSNTAATSGTNTWGFPVVFGTTATRLSAVNKAAPSVSARLSLFSIKKVVKQLRRKNVRPFADGLLKGIFNSDSIADLRTDPDFKNWLQNNNSSPMEQGEATVPVEGVKVYMSNNLPYYRATAHSCDTSFIFGQGAYGVVDIGGGKGFEIIIKRPGPNDTSNAANLYGTLAYKVSMVAAALNVSAGRVLLTHSKP